MTAATQDSAPALPQGMPQNPTMRDITRWAEGRRAQGVPMCVCAQGTVDLAPPKVLTDELFAASSRAQGTHRYPAQLGNRALRAAFRDYLREQEGVSCALEVEGTDGVGPNHFLVCSGVNGGFVAILHALKERHGSAAPIAVIDPSYLYHDLDTLAVFGVGSEHIASRDDLTLDREAVERAIKGGVRGLIVCNPANPHGLMLSDEELSWLVELCGKHGATVAFDEVYADITAGGRPFRSALHVLKELPEHVVVVRGWSKILGLQGDRVGCVVAHPKMLPSIMRWHDIAYIGVNAVAQDALATYLAKHRDDFRRHAAMLNATIEKNASTLEGALAKSLGWKMVQSERVGHSTIYRLFEHTSATDMGAVLDALRRGLAVAPGNIFFAPEQGGPLTGRRRPNTRYVRLSLAMPTEAVEAGARQLLSGALLF